MIIDTHIHLDDPRYDEDLELVLQRAFESGVERFVIPGADPASLPRAVALAEAHEPIYFSVGVHPYDLAHYDTQIFETYLKHPKCVAVGECGLDYFRLEGDAEQIAAEKAAQAEIFRAQIRIAIAGDKPLIVHIRDASNDAKAILEEENAGVVGGVLHCFNADEQLLSLGEHNFYFGIGGVLTFKNARKLVQVLPKIPKNRLLLETDGPYLTPHPYRGKRNEPAYTRLVAEKMSALLSLCEAQIETVTTDNAEQLFNFT